MVVVVVVVVTAAAVVVAVFWGRCRKVKALEYSVCSSF